MLDESRKAMIEYAIAQYQENKGYSVFTLEGQRPDRDEHQVSRFELVNGEFLSHRQSGKVTLYPLSAVQKIEFPSEGDSKPR